MAATKGTLVNYSGFNGHATTQELTQSDSGTAASTFADFLLKLIPYVRQTWTSIQFPYDNGVVVVNYNVDGRKYRESNGDFSLAATILG